MVRRLRRVPATSPVAHTKRPPGPKPQAAARIADSRRRSAAVQSSPRGVPAIREQPAIRLAPAPRSPAIRRLAAFGPFSSILRDLAALLATLAVSPIDHPPVPAGPALGTASVTRAPRYPALVTHCWSPCVRECARAYRPARYSPSSPEVASSFSPSTGRKLRINNTLAVTAAKPSARSVKRLRITAPLVDPDEANARRPLRAPIEQLVRGRR